MTERKAAPGPLEITEGDILYARELAPSPEQTKTPEKTAEEPADFFEARAKRATLLSEKFKHIKERLAQTPELSFEDIATRLLEDSKIESEDLPTRKKRAAELKEKLLLVLGSDAEMVEAVLILDWERINRATPFFDLMDEAATEAQHEPHQDFLDTLNTRHELLGRRVDDIRKIARGALAKLAATFQNILEREIATLTDASLIARLEAGLKAVSLASEALHATVHQKEAEPREVAFVNMERFDDLELGSGQEQIERILDLYGIRSVFGKTVATVAFENRVRDLSAEYGFKGFASGEYDYNQGRINILKSSVSDRPQALEHRDAKTMLLHEWGHANDPTFQGIRKKNTFAKESLEELVADTRFIAEWEQVIKEDPTEVTAYITKFVRSGAAPTTRFREDWAESIALFLAAPWLLAQNSPKRYRFCLEWAQKNIPRFASETHIARLEETTKKVSPSE